MNLPFYFNNIKHIQSKIDNERNKIRSKQLSEDKQAVVAEIKDPHPTAFTCNIIDIASQTPTVILKYA